MKFYSKLADGKIHGVNLGGEITIGEYLSFLPDILEKNDYQRKRVSSAGKTYELLKSDLIKGCVIPPIILATTEKYQDELQPLIHDVMSNGGNEQSWEKIKEIVRKTVEAKELVILDGLQRSLTLLSVQDAIGTELTEDEYQNFLTNSIRIEIYAGLSKPGILYRMMTLNTGQTPMSFRHQLEILYHDYIGNDDLPDNITVVKEVDTARARGESRYKYSEVIDMFYAFNTGSPVAVNRQALISELKELDFLEGFSVGGGSDDMKSLLLLHNKIVTKVSDLSGSWRPTTEEDGGVSRPFATNITSALSRGQAMTGLGAECRRLLKLDVIEDLDDLANQVNQLHFSDEASVSLDQMIIILDQIAKRAKRIGDAQRIYFQLVFRALFHPGSDHPYDLSTCWTDAQMQYESLHA